jgi:hypothetical protein
MTRGVLERQQSNLPLFLCPLCRTLSLTLLDRLIKHAEHEIAEAAPAVRPSIAEMEPTIVKAAAPAVA